MVVASPDRRTASTADHGRLGAVSGPGTHVGAHVAVIGPGDADERTCAVAREVGRLLAGHGVVVVTGGGTGVMAAASEGAHRADPPGRTVGILPGASRGGANPHVDVAVATGLGEYRNGVVVASADGVIAVGGNAGTLI